MLDVGWASTSLQPIFFKQVTVQPSPAQPSLQDGANPLKKDVFHPLDRCKCDQIADVRNCHSVTCQDRLLGDRISAQAAHAIHASLSEQGPFSYLFTYLIIYGITYAAASYEVRR